MKMNIFKVIGMAAITLLLFVACSSDNENNASEEKVVDNIKELVNDYSVGIKEEYNVSVRPQQLIITDSEENEEIYALPEDEFFISFAPYIDETHPCTFHNLTSCQGEMVEEEVVVYIEDADGNVLVDETVTTLANGFMDFWLPRENTYNIIISQDGKKAEAEFSTFGEDPTCISTVQLS